MKLLLLLSANPPKPTENPRDPKIIGQTLKSGRNLSASEHKRIHTLLIREGVGTRPWDTLAFSFSRCNFFSLSIRLEYK